MRVLEASSVLFVAVSALGALGCSSGDNTTTPGNDAGNNSPVDSSTPTGDDGGGDAGCVPFTQPAVSTLQTPTISFAKDVLPVFQHSCVFSGCHQNTSGNLEYLGDNFDLDTDGGYIGPSGFDAATYPQSYAKKVYDGIVDASTIENPSMVFVKPGDPANSYTMRKMDGDLCSLPTQCPAQNSLWTANYAGGQENPTPGPCGVSMPKDQALLDQTTADGGLGPREIVRRWIAQGAPNN